MPYPLSWDLCERTKDHCDDESFVYKEGESTVRSGSWPKLEDPKPTGAKQACVIGGARDEARRYAGLDILAKCFPSTFNLLS